MSLPTSRNLERIVVDATAIVSHLIGGKATRIFREAAITEFATSQFTFGEVTGFLPKLAVKRKLVMEQLTSTLALLPLSIYRRDTYEAEIDEAKKRIQDSNDVELLALALHLKAPVWTNDRRDFGTAGIVFYRTGRLLRMMENGDLAVVTRPSGQPDPSTPSP
jgi:predicted nucleic acid-binding protein